MAHVFETVLSIFLVLFVVMPRINLSEEFVGPKLRENSWNSSTTTALAVKSDKTASENSAKVETWSSFYGQKIRNEILEEIENINNYMKMIAEELASGDGVIIVDTVKTIGDVNLTEEETPDNNEQSKPLPVSSAKTQSSLKIKYPPDARAAEPAMCKKSEAPIFGLTA